MKKENYEPPTYYKSVGILRFATICYSNQLLARWIRTHSENPTVSFRQKLAVMQALRLKDNHSMKNLKISNCFTRSWLIVLFILFSTINKGYGQDGPEFNEDTAVGFGYNIMWIAVKTINKEKVAQTIGLKSTKPSNWQNGIDEAYKDAIFITPPVEGWILVVGMKLPSGDSKESIKEVAELLKKLSTQFGEAQFFCTNRVVDYHCWIKSTNGKIERIEPLQIVYLIFLITPQLP